MINLTSTSDKIQLSTDSAGSITAHISWVDLGGTTVTPGRVNVPTISTSTTTDIVPSPGSGVYRNIKYLTIHNTHASILNNIQVIHTDGTNVTTLIKYSLLPGESAVYTDSAGWQKFTSMGTDSHAYNGPTDIQVFATDGTWVKPTSFNPRITVVKVWGAGGGGGAGASLNTAVVATGGGGGGGGAYDTTTFMTSELPSTVGVVIGIGGTAGIPGAAGAAGGAGGIGGNTAFGTLVYAYGGGGGGGGAITATTTGGGRQHVTHVIVVVAADTETGSFLCPLRASR